MAQPDNNGRTQMHDTTNTDNIRRLNDCFRRSLVFGGQTVLTAGVSTLDTDAKAALLRLVQTFEAFTPDNDPHGEHDFGAIDFQGIRYFWKIDYYDLAGRFASPDAANPAITRRVLTIMRADEY
jgi:hypothetical protein